MFMYVNVFWVYVNWVYVMYVNWVVTVLNLGYFHWYLST